MPQTVTNYIPFRYKAYFPHNNPMLLDGEQVPNAAFNILEVNSLYVKSGTSGALQIPIFEQDAVTPYLWDGPTDNAASDLNVFLGHLAATGPGLVLTNNTVVGNRNTLPTGAQSVIVMGYQNTGSLACVIYGASNVTNGSANLIVGQTNSSTGTANFIFGAQNIARGTSNYVDGLQNTVSGVANSALGSQNVCTGTAVQMYGNSNVATGTAHLLYGYGNNSTGTANVVFGSTNNVFGVSSLVYGYNNIATGAGNNVFGQTNRVNATGAIVLGYNNTLSLTNGATGTIILGSNISATTGGRFYANPIRQDVAQNALYWNSTTSEITYVAAPSTIAAKEDVQPVQLSTNILDQMQPVTYKLKDDQKDPKSTHIGFIAEDLLPLESAMVLKNSDGEVTTIDWSVVTTYLVAEIKSLRQRVAQLEAKL